MKIQTKQQKTTRSTPKQTSFLKLRFSLYIFITITDYKKPRRTQKQVNNVPFTNLDQPTPRLIREFTIDGDDNNYNGR